MQPAIFLDRDGVIIENNPHYVLSWKDVIFLPDSLQALAKIAKSVYRIIIVSNQSAVGQGLITLDEVWNIQNQIIQEINIAGGRIDQTYFCPHTIKDHCLCRKPLPRMILTAAQDFQIDLQASFLIGDALSDLEAGKAAGISQTYLVRTGRGLAQLELQDAKSLEPFQVFDSIGNAINEILETLHPNSHQDIS